METEQNKRRVTTIVILIATAVLIGGAVFTAQQTTQKNGETASQPAQQTPNQTAPSPIEPGSYQDGKYSATGNYQSPGGGQKIKINVTLEAGIIMASSAEGDDKSSDSRFYQASFIKNYKEKVVGKPIDLVELDHVGNSSLTPIGFNDALEDIKNQAKD